jgi:hypothetical protein
LNENGPFPLICFSYHFRHDTEVYLVQYMNLAGETSNRLSAEMPSSNYRQAGTAPPTDIQHYIDSPTFHVRHESQFRSLPLHRHSALVWFRYRTSCIVFLPTSSKKAGKLYFRKSYLLLRAKILSVTNSPRCWYFRTVLPLSGTKYGSNIYL